MLYTTPRICNSTKMSTRVYIRFYYNNKPVKEYSGKCIGLNIFPGRASTLGERTTLLKLLCDKVTESLHNGTYKITPKETVIPQSSFEVLTSALNSKLLGYYSEHYKRDLRYVFKEFVSFLTDEERAGTLNQIPISRVASFLDRFTSSGTYYMNKRTNLSVLFSAAGVILDEQLFTFKGVAKKKVKAKLNVAYTQEQILPLLKFLKTENYNLYLCCMLTYLCWLRPHKEVRLLNKNSFDDDYRYIRLGGGENKSGRVRVVYVPDILLEHLEPILSSISSEDNLFTRQNTSLNPDYFKTAWSRLREKMLKLKLIGEDQTIYSFRHTAAIGAYRKTKDLNTLRMLLGHSDMIVTLKYLRSLGEIGIEELKQYTPDL